MISVKFAKTLGTALTEYALEDGAVAQDLLNAAGYTLQQNEKLVKKGGQALSLSDPLSDGDVIVVSVEVKGGATV